MVYRCFLEAGLDESGVCFEDVGFVEATGKVYWISAFFVGVGFFFCFIIGKGEGINAQQMNLKSCQFEIERYCFCNNF